MNLEKEQGKELTRLTYLTETEKEYLLNQILHNKPKKRRELKEILTKTKGQYTTKIYGKTIKTDVPNTTNKQKVFPLAQEQSLIIKTAKIIIDQRKRKQILDICCGSGVLGICIANKQDQVTGIDINPKAIETATINAYNNKIKAKYYIQDASTELPKEKYDIIVSNPPYNAQIQENYDRTTHAGRYGQEVNKNILRNLDKCLKKDGKALIISNFLIKDNQVLYTEQLKGEITLIHKGIHDAKTLEGLKTLYLDIEQPRKLARGYLHKQIEKGRFTHITKAILIYQKNKKKTKEPRLIYNWPTDFELLNKETIGKIK